MPIRRTEREIRARIADLELLNRQPCDCALEDGKHLIQCVVGGKFIEVEVKSLQWVLGENARQDEFVERTTARAAELRKESAT